MYLTQIGYCDYQIMMDRMTGKTLSFCYIEFVSGKEAQRAIAYGNQRLLKDRMVTVSCCSSQEFLASTFPKWQSGFNRIKPNYPTQPIFNPFITLEEINSILVICKNYKVTFT